MNSRRANGGRRTLADLKKNEQAILETLDLPSDLSLRLMEIGFVPGATISASHSAPGGDPRVFQVEGAEIALRLETARQMLIEGPLPESAGGSS